MEFVILAIYKSCLVCFTYRRKPISLVLLLLITNLAVTNRLSIWKWWLREHLKEDKCKTGISAAEKEDYVVMSEAVFCALL